MHILKQLKSPKNWIKSILNHLLLFLIPWNYLTSKWLKVQSSVKHLKASLQGTLVKAEFSMTSTHLLKSMMSFLALGKQTHFISEENGASFMAAVSPEEHSICCLGALVRAFRSLSCAASTDDSKVMHLMTHYQRTLIF